MNVSDGLRIGEISDAGRPRSTRLRTELSDAHGFVPDALVTVLRRAPAGDPTVYGIDGMQIALREETAEASVSHPPTPPDRNRRELEKIAANLSPRDQTLKFTNLPVYPDECLL